MRCSHHVLDTRKLSDSPYIGLRATEVVMTSAFGVFELDDSRGAPVTFEIGDLATS
jgi:hypothetical protein